MKLQQSGILVFATNNLHKIEEVNGIAGEQLSLLSLKSIGCTEEIPETAETFEGNALLKARYVFDNYHYNCFSDDSGLEVEALDNKPGVYSARFAGEQGNHKDNNDLLLKLLQGRTNRTARFRTVICLILDGKVHYFEGIVTGTILDQLSGNNGFGYDPLFVPEGYNKSFAEMTPDEKNSISHRGKAVAKLVEFLRNSGFING